MVQWRGGRERKTEEVLGSNAEFVMTIIFRRLNEKTVVWPKADSHGASLSYATSLRHAYDTLTTRKEVVGF